MRDVGLYHAILGLTPPWRIVAVEQQIQQRLNPFAVADEIGRNLQQIYRLANYR